MFAPAAAEKHMKVDYLIIGQGICGSFLSRDLLKAGRSVMVIDESLPFTASKVASGVINPITGRRMVKTWEIDKLMPFAVQAYSDWGEEAGISFVRQCNILDFHPTPQMVLAFAERQAEEKQYLHLPEDTERWREWFRFDFSIGEIGPAWLVDLDTLLTSWRKELQLQDALLEERFDLEHCKVSESGVVYKNITAGKIIFCDGVAGFDNPYFNRLPYARNKGQALIAEISGLPSQNIYKKGITIVPWKDGLFWIGSSYEWEFTDIHPSPAFRENTEAQLRHLLKVPFRIIDHIASERPANMERRPFAGLHPVMPSVGLLNGMGTKGCSLTPWFSAELTAFLVHGKPITPQADVRRFTKILSR